MARPKKELDGEQIRELAGFGLTAAEISAFLRCSQDTIERRFADVIKAGRDNLSASLKRRQVMLALDGNVAMLIWLGKQYLGQREKVEHKQSDEGISITIKRPDKG